MFGDFRPLSTLTGAGVRFCSSETDLVFYCKNCSFINCQSYRHGGGIGQPVINGGFKSGYLTLEGCIFASNFAYRRGGGMDIRNLNISCTNCTYLHNKAGESGGAVASETNTTIIFTDTVFVRNLVSNQCQIGGGGSVSIFLEGPKLLNFSNCIFIRSEVQSFPCTGFILYFIFCFLIYIDIDDKGFQYTIGVDIARDVYNDENSSMIETCSNAVEASITDTYSNSDSVRV
jgi:predicted outer membrane repeat protein